MRIVFTLIAMAIVAAGLTGCRGEVEVGDTRSSIGIDR